MADPFDQAAMQGEGIANISAITAEERKNAAFNALTKIYGAPAGDPENWLKDINASKAQQTAPGEVAATNATNQDTVQSKQRMDQYRALTALEGSVDPTTGSVDPKTFDQIIGPAAEGLGLGDPAHYKQLQDALAAPGGAAHIDSLRQALIGPVKVQGQPTFGLDAQGNPVALNRDQYGNITQQGLGGTTTVGQQNASTAATNAVTKRAGESVQDYNARVRAANQTYGPDGAPIAPTAPLGVRSNNALNLQPGGKEAQFSTPTAGMLAASKQIDSYAADGLTTVGQIVTKWSGPNPKNNTPAYVADVAKRMGVGPNDKLDLSDPNVKGRLMEAMAQHENGQPLNAGAPAQAAAADPLARLTGKGRALAVSQAQSIATQKTNLQTANTILDSVDKQITPYTTGVGSLIKDIPGTAQANLKANLATLSSLGLTSWISSLKNAQGQTGIGRVLQSEANAAMKIYGNMEQDQSAKQLQFHAKLFRTAVNSLYQHAAAAYKQNWGFDPPGLEQSSAPDAATVAAYKKYGIQ